jgi:glucose-6-phosphate dehydrogenase assembly protein OpcA
MSALPSGRLWWPTSEAGSTPVTKRLALDCNNDLAEATHLGEPNGAEAQDQADLCQHMR